MMKFLRKLFKSNKLYKDISTDEFKVLMTKESVILDVRTSSEYSSGNSPKSQNINVASFDFINEAKELDKSKNILVYCKSGMRSSRASKMLTKLGFTKVYNLSGGILAWQEEENLVS